MNTADKVAIMIAWIEGKTIQMSYRSLKNPWYDLKVEPQWDWVNIDYRIKPQE